jgi:hypothetical protein
MQFQPHLCPECGEPADEVTTYVLVHAPIEPIEPIEDNEFDYTHEDIHVLWDTHEIYHFDDGTVMLHCKNNHGWSATDT